MYALREPSPVETIYDDLHRSAATLRWPSLVRERAVEPWGSAGEGAVSDAAAVAVISDIDENPIDSDHEARTAPTPAPASHADPDDDLYILGEQCAEAYIQADALHYQAMQLLAEFDHRKGWQDTGFSSTAEWLAWRIGIQPGAARERLRTALALEQLPATSQAMERGELSFTKVRALTRVATPDNEETLLDFARAGSAANLERVVRGWKKLDRRSEVTAEQVRHRSRRLSAFVDDDGMVVVRGRLDPEVGALLMRAIDAASDVLYRKGARAERKVSGCCVEAASDLDEAAADQDEAAPDQDETTPEQRRADAMGLVAERALAAGFGGGGAPISGSRAERYQVMLHVDAATLEEDGDPGQSELEDGTRVSAEQGIHVALLTPICSGDENAESSGWRRGLPTYAGGI